jgi:nicotinamide-nucleotide amidase
MRSPDAERATAVLRRSRAQLEAALGDSVFSTDGRSLPHVLGDLLRKKHLTFAAAESCTGGLLLQRMTDVAGSSAYVKGGVVAYSNELKIQLLGVDAALLDAHGAVSEPVAAAMADGIHERTGADVCVSITGIAGPGGGSEAKPVGTVVIGVRLQGQRLSVQTHLFPGGREMVRLQSSQMALDRVRRMLATEETQKKH